MTIIDALTNRSEYGDVRVLNGDRWLCASIEGDTVMFIVNERKYKQKCIGWTILHLIFGWLYVLYWAIEWWGSVNLKW